MRVARNWSAWRWCGAAAAEVRGETADSRPLVRRVAGFAAMALTLALVAWAGFRLLPAAELPLAAPPPSEPVALMETARNPLDELQPFSTAAAVVDVVAGWWDSAGPAHPERCSVAREGALCARLRLNERLLRSLNRPLAIALLDGRGRWLCLAAHRGRRRRCGRCPALATSALGHAGRALGSGTRCWS